jgi:thiol-disulfide isomerase/thioredoxin
MTTATLVLAFFAIGAESSSSGPQEQVRPIILDFTATWCGPCQAMKPVVEQLKQAGYPVRAVDIDQHPDLAERYNVHAVPTFVVVQPGGEELGRISGANTASGLATLYRKSVAGWTADRAEAEPEERVAEAEPEAPDADSEESEGTTRYKPWESVVRIRVEPRSNMVEFGSGTIIYSTPEESVILTCAHIFHLEGSRRQYAPRQFPCKITVDLFDGKLSGGRTPQVHTMATGIPAEVIDYDFPTDVGLIRIRPGKKLPYSPVVPPGFSTKENMRLTTVGCSQGQDATAWSTWVTRSMVRLGQHGGVYEATECAYPPIQGRSGGGLFTLDGMVAGVCDFNDGPVGKHGLYASPRSIHRLINRNNLQMAYAGSDHQSGPEAAQVASREPERPRSRAVAGRGLPADKFRAQSPQPTERMIPIPPPSLLGAALDEEDGASTSRVARRTTRDDSGIWDSAPSAEELAEAARPRTSDARRRPTYGGSERSAPRMSRMEMHDLGADGDLFSAAPTLEEFRRQSASTGSEKPAKSGGDPWKAAGSESR